MASRRVPKVTSKEGASQCKEKHAVLLSPVGKLEISGCETGLHEIKLPKMSVLPNGAEASAGCEVCEGAEGMTEPLKQCTAWLRAYFCEPARTEQLPVPPFHHPLLQQEEMEPRPRADGWVPAHRFTAPGRPCIIYKCSEFLVPLSFLIQFRRWLIKRESRTQEGAQDSPSQDSLSPEVRAASRQERGSPCPSPVLPVPLASTCW
uniref:O-6-methylguanine-DNA methyltransferase n=1 Tax=Anas platyrhynchos platyrhynchos TaxID=8840 RepID=A0A493T7G3_ANAPP